jgi:hypothetical protein
MARQPSAEMPTDVETKKRKKRHIRNVRKINDLPFVINTSFLDEKNPGL